MKFVDHVGMCGACGKKSYTSRKRAKNAAKALHPSEHLAAYPCGNYWHFGHLPYAVMKSMNPRGRL